MTHTPSDDGIAMTATPARLLTLARCHAAHVSSLPTILRDVPMPTDEKVSARYEATPLAMWCASIGKTAADVAALLFKMPAPVVVREIFEDEIRQTIAAELLIRQVDDTEWQHMEDVAWLAFDRRMERHGWNGTRKATA